MKTIITFLASMLAIAATTHAKVYDVSQLGADSRGETLCTHIINQAIQSAANDGGGTIYFPAGLYLTGAIHLESNITIHIESGATIRFSDNFDHYLPFVQMRWEGVVMNSFSPLFHAAGKENLTICGRGKIDGQGKKWWDEHHRINQTLQNPAQTQTLTPYQTLWDENNTTLTVEPYYQKSINRKFFRPPFIQFFQCKNILIEGITIVNSPFWTVNPEFCDNVTVNGITIINDPSSPNTDGVNPSSCSNVHISNCHIDVGDDCITIKSGRDKDGRTWNKPCENITITNCTMLAGHGGVVIGSEMSGGVKKVTISNCVFDGTDAGIRLKSSRGRGGIVEEIRVDNIVMNNIQKNAFIFDLFYDKSSTPEPLSERTPIFRNIHLSNITGNNIKKIGYIAGLEEMPIDEISFSNINMKAQEGFDANHATNLSFHNVDFSSQQSSSIEITNSSNIALDNIRAKQPNPQHPVVLINNTRDVLINNCYPNLPPDKFLHHTNSKITWGHNGF
jgi:polygalacturonase